ncbi:hypothetical protein V5F53_01105 [Xanthobacter sp. V4C-4]|uniref:hypothetical protein n=1 Tax=Xanthobacter cornucopiae TaxID=3119924 RepID=UPI00372CD8C3
MKSPGHSRDSIIAEYARAHRIERLGIRLSSGADDGTPSLADLQEFPIMKKLSLACAMLGTVAVSISAPAWADKAAADACAAGLDANGQAIYAATAPQAGTTSDLRGLLTSTTKALVTNGTVPMGAARAAAEAAGSCLTKLR